MKYMKYLHTYENYRDFDINEGTKIISDEELYELIKTNCKDFSLDDPIIYRDVELYDKRKYLINNIPSKNYYEENGKKYRRSAYSTNHYTLLLNHLPSWSKYPKRNVICSTYRSSHMATSQFRVIPFDDVKIGVTHASDIQESYKDNGLYKKFEISGFWDLNEFFRNDGIQDINWTIFKNSMEEKYKETKNEIFNIETLNNIMSPEKMNFEVLDYKEFINNDSIHQTHREIWFDMNHLLIPLYSIDSFRNKFNI